MATIFDNLLKPTPIDLSRFQYKSTPTITPTGTGKNFLSGITSFLGKLFTQPRKLPQSPVGNPSVNPSSVMQNFQTTQIGGFTIPKLNLPGITNSPSNTTFPATTPIMTPNQQNQGQTTQPQGMGQTPLQGQVSGQNAPNQTTLTANPSNPTQATTPSGAVVNIQTGQVVSAQPTSTGVQPQTPNAAEATGLNAVLKQIEGLSTEQKQLLGLAESSEQKAQREGMQKTLDRLVSLQDELIKASAPKEDLANLDKVIYEQTQALNDLIPGKFLESQRGLKDIGISQSQLEREVASRREPVARGLADLLFSRSIMGEIQKQQIEAVQSRINAASSQFEIQQALASLAPSKALPSAITSKIFENVLAPKIESQITEVGGRKLLVNTKTGETIKDLGSAFDLKDELQLQKTMLDIQNLQRDMQSGVLNDKEIKAVDSSPEAKKLSTLYEFKTKANIYLTRLDQYGFEPFGRGKTSLDQAYADLKIAYKEAANLGALTGPDVEIIVDVVKPATGIRGATSVIFGGGVSGIKGGVQNLIQNIDTDAQRAYSQLIKRNLRFGQSEYVQGLGQPFLGQTTPGVNQALFGILQQAIAP